MDSSPVTPSPWQEWSPSSAWRRRPRRWPTYGDICDAPPRRLLKNEALATLRRGGTEHVGGPQSVASPQDWRLEQRGGNQREKGYATDDDHQPAPRLSRRYALKREHVPGPRPHQYAEQQCGLHDPGRPSPPNEQQERQQHAHDDDSHRI